MKKNFKFLVIALIVAFFIVFNIESFTGFFTGLLGEENATEILVISTVPGPYSGNKQTERGMQIAMDELREQENGTNFKVIYETEWRSDWNVTKSNVEAVIDSGVKIIVPVSFSAYEALTPLAEERGVIQFSPVCYPLYPFIGHNLSYTFITNDCVVSPALMMAEIVYEKFNISNITIVYWDESFAPHDVGGFMKDLFKKRFEEIGGTVTSEIGIDLRSIDTDQLKIVLNNTNSKHIFLASRAGMAGLNTFPVLQIATELNLTVFTRIYRQEMIILPLELTNNIIFISDDYDPLNSNEFDSEYRSRYVFDPGKISRELYETIKILDTVMRTCGEDTECIREELHTREFDSVFGKIKFSENGVIIRPYMVKIVRDGVIDDLFEYSLLENQ